MRGLNKDITPDCGLGEVLGNLAGDIKQFMEKGFCGEGSDRIRDKWPDA